MQLNGLYYHLRTFGCQMNQHDSERVAGLLEELGALPALDIAQADIVVYMTCCVREAADTRLLGQVAGIKGLPLPPSGRRLIAIGGCVGQRDGAALIDQLPHVDVVFGTHNIASLPSLLSAALSGTGPEVEVITNDLAKLQPPTANLPSRRVQPWHAWVTVTTGCDNHCSYCIVPTVRGAEVSRPFEEVLAEVAQLLSDGVVEVTLLGQNVNSYGRDLYGQPRFAELLAAVGSSGVRRLRFTTSHPKDLSPEAIGVFAQTESVMPHLHLPVQSGSDPVLAAMNRGYSNAHYLSLIDAVRSAAAAAGKGDGSYLGSVALSTDIIVGFPGEGEADFQATCDLVSAVGFSQVFSFIYSKRAGTPAASFEDSTPAAVVQERFQRLVEIIQASAWQHNQLELGQTLPVLFEGPSKRDPSMLSGRSPKNITVHVPLPASQRVEEYIGRILPVKVDQARTWYLSGCLV